MSRDKQIEEIFKDLCEAPIGAVKEDFTIGTMKDSHTDLCIRTIAGHLYANGYRKASDVAREIFEEIDKSIATLEYRANTPRKTVKVEELKAQVNWILHEVVPNTIAELIKTYESEVK